MGNSDNNKIYIKKKKKEARQRLKKKKQLQKVMNQVWKMFFSSVKLCMLYTSVIIEQYFWLVDCLYPILAGTPKELPCPFTNLVQVKRLIHRSSSVQYQISFMQASQRDCEKCVHSL